MLNNTSNNNITLAKLGTIIRVNLKQKRLHYMSYVLNLIAKAYLSS